MEDISAAGDAQVGQAVRDIHRKAQQALKQHLRWRRCCRTWRGSR